MATTFATTKAESIKTGDVMRQVDEHKTHTDFYHYRAETVFIGDLVDAIHDADGTFLGNRITDGVEIKWTPLEDGKPFTSRYSRAAIVDIATTPVTNINQLITHEEHSEEN
jgi:hypothetical protein